MAILYTAIPEDELIEFKSTVINDRYPGMRNGVMYSWQSDYENFLLKNENQ